MSAIIKSVFQATVGLLIKKGRDLVAEKLREGDVDEEKFRSLIVDEIEDIKSKLDSIALKDLLASVSFFKEGLVLFFELFDETIAGKDGAATEEGAVGKGNGSAGHSLNFLTDVVDSGRSGFTFHEELEKIQRFPGSNSTTRWFLKAQAKFQDSCRKATEAFNDRSLNTLNRILAMQYRVMATILEAADNPREALSQCTLCLQELHAMPAVRKNFKTALKPSHGKRFFALPSSATGERERGQIIFTVVYINKVVYDVKQMVGKTAELLSWPCIDTGEEKVDPLRDVRVAEILRKQDMTHSFVPPSLGLASGDKERRIILPRRIASTKEGHFIVAESGDNGVKVFNHSGKFWYPLECPGNDDEYVKERRIILPQRIASTKEGHFMVAESEDNGVKVFDHSGKFLYPLKCPCNVLDVAADREGNLYVLQASRNNFRSEVCVFNKAGDFQRKFELEKGFRCHKMTVVDSKVLVLVEEEEARLLKSSGKASQTSIHVYDTNGVLILLFR